MSPRTPSAAAHRRHYARIFSALGDEVRLAIIARLNKGRPHSIAELSSGMRVSRQAITKHLNVLERARVVRSARHGREKLFELDVTTLRDVRTYADDHIN